MYLCRMSSSVELLKKAGRTFLFVIAGFFLFCVLFAFTTGPYWLYHWLGTGLGTGTRAPRYIVVLGGAGHPSESSLMRAWYAAAAFRQYPGSEVVVSQPSAAGLPLQQSDAWGIRRELILRGVDSTKILLEIKGKNTREEGQEVLKRVPEAAKTPCLLVSTPEHIRRAVLCFRRLGYEEVSGLPTFGGAAPADLHYKDDQLGGNTAALPEVGGSLQLRYQFWNHLRYQILCYRELCALAWYWLRGWV